MKRAAAIARIVLFVAVIAMIAVLARLAYAQGTVTANQGPPSSSAYRGWKVQGTDQAGQAPSGMPTLTAGSDGSAVRTLRTDTLGRVQIDPSSLGSATAPLVVTNRPGYLKTGAPTATVAVSTVSAAATGLSASSCYRVACSVPLFYRSGTATPTALTTDNPFYGPAVEKVCVPSTDTALAFVTASGTGSCGLTLLSNTP